MQSTIRRTVWGRAKIGSKAATVVDCTRLVGRCNHSRPRPQDDTPRSGIVDSRVVTRSGAILKITRTSPGW